MNHINKTAIITGSAKGLGREIAIALGKNGCNVVVHYNTSKKQAEMVKSIIEKSGSKAITAITIKADLTNPDEVKRLFAETHKQFGRIDFLINNVGNFIFKDISKIEYPEWKHILDTTLNSTFLCCKECLHYMRKQKFGRIINDTSFTVKEPAENLVLSNVYRTAVVSLAKSLSRELAGYGITINNICPGYADTDRLKEIFSNQAKKKEISVEDVYRNIISGMPIGRLQKPEEIAALVVFLASEKASSITGSTINVDGGLMRGLT